MKPWYFLVVTTLATIVFGATSVHLAEKISELQVDLKTQKQHFAECREEVLQCEAQIVKCKAQVVQCKAQKKEELLASLSEHKDSFLIKGAMLIKEYKDLLDRCLESFTGTIDDTDRFLGKAKKILED